MSDNRRMSDLIADTVQPIFDEYLAEGLKWEWALAPMQAPPQGPGQPPQLNFGTCFIVTMPMPLLGSDSEFLVNWTSPDCLALREPKMAREVVFNCVQALRQQKADFLRGQQ